ncbi:MAG: hypothetical protein ACI9SG_000632 [Maribacter sp.]|jgi:hypothetical protein
MYCCFISKKQVPIDDYTQEFNKQQKPILFNLTTSRPNLNFLKTTLLKFGKKFLSVLFGNKIIRHCSSRRMSKSFNVSKVTDMFYFSLKIKPIKRTLQLKIVK